MRKCILLFLAVLFMAFGCSKKAYNSSNRQVWTDDSERSSVYRSSGYMYGGLAEESSWEGTGYNPEAPAGIEGQTPQAFRDMSNLYGRTSVAAGSKDGAGKPAAFTAENAGRKIVKRANIRIRVENPETAEISINDLMTQYGAYATAAAIYENENSRQYTIRVPSAAYNDFLAGMSGMGKVLSRSENDEDVTVRYYDLEGHLETKKELLKTFQSYLGKAKNIEEILSVERRIAELQSEIDRTGIDLRGLANDVDYSTVHLDIMGPAASISYKYPTLPDRIKELFGSFGNFLSSLAVILIGIVIFGIPILLLLVFFFWILFGKVGLLKKLWRMAADRKSEDKKDRAQ